MTDGQFLHYDGPAVIDGTEFPIVSLREHREGRLRSWDGTATMSALQAPEGFAPDLFSREAVPVELPDGRHGKALLAIGFDGQSWQVELSGAGPAPAHPRS